ncbi:hypothetical protein ABW21_db0205754 [Orbilia brochopaga]|nr:hypothetical protein ABW21_db0205754 [Drechslerella brochopaga]
MQCGAAAKWGFYLRCILRDLFNDVHFSPTSNIHQLIRFTINRLSFFDFIRIIPRLSDSKVKMSSYGDSMLGHPTDPNVGLPQGWVARWDQNNQHWFYVDTNTGRTQWERPGANYGPAPSQSGGSSSNYDDHYDDKGYHKNWESHQDKYSAESNHEIPSGRPKSPKKHSHWGGYAAAGLGALGLGAIGGALLGNEADDIAGWAGNKVGSAENKIDNIETDIVDAPENVAQWTGNKIGEAEGKIDNIETDIVDAPENVANWAGNKVGEVEQYGDNVDNAYDEGKYEGRYDEDNNDGDDY